MGKKKFAALLGAVVGVMMLVSAVPAYAAQIDVWNVEAPAKETVTLPAKKSIDKPSYTYKYADLTADAVKAKATVKATSSNKKVATVSVKTTGTTTRMYFTAKAPGTTKITTTVTCKGKKSTKVTTLKVVKWSNPVKTFKVGKKSFASKYKNADYYYSGAVSTGKLNVKGASGWKVTYIGYAASGNAKCKTIKNGTKVGFKKGSTSYVKVCLVNKKIGDREEIILQANKTRTYKK